MLLEEVDEFVGDGGKKVGKVAEHLRAKDNVGDL